MGLARHQHDSSGLIGVMARVMEPSLPLATAHDRPDLRSARGRISMQNFHTVSMGFRPMVGDLHGQPGLGAPDIPKYLLPQLPEAPRCLGQLGRSRIQTLQAQP